MDDKTSRITTYIIACSPTSPTVSLETEIVIKILKTLFDEVLHVSKCVLILKPRLRFCCSKIQNFNSV